MVDEIVIEEELDKIDTGSIVVPEGNYALKVIDCSIEDGPTDKVLKVRYEIESDGAFKGAKPFPDHISLSPNARWKLALFLKAIGAPGKAKKFNIKRFIGKRLIATVLQDEYNNAPLNKYMNYTKFTEEAAKSLKESASNKSDESEEDSDVEW